MVEENNEKYTFNMLGINVIELLLGVLIARIIVLWVEVFKIFIEWRVNVDDKVAVEDKNLFFLRWKSALLSTAILLLVILIIYVWYLKELRDIRLNLLHQEKKLLRLQ